MNSSSDFYRKEAKLRREIESARKRRRDDRVEAIVFVLCMIFGVAALGALLVLSGDYGTGT